MRTSDQTAVRTNSVATLFGDPLHSIPFLSFSFLSVLFCSVLFVSFLSFLPAFFLSFDGKCNLTLKLPLSALATSQTNPVPHARSGCALMQDAVVVVICVRQVH